MPDLLLLGDSHLARVRRARLRRLEIATGLSVLNAAVGGACSLDLPQQLEPTQTAAEVAVVSVGTNDAAPWKQVALDTFREALRAFVPNVPAARVVYLGSPGVDQNRLAGVHDRTNARIREYVEAAADVVRTAGGEFLDCAAVLAGAGADFFEEDGVHLNKTGYDLLLPALASATKHR